MLPVPTTATRVAFIGLAIGLAAAIALASPIAVLLASGGLLGLGLVLAATLPIGRRARREQLELAWWLDHDVGPGVSVVVPGTPAPIRCYIRHLGTSRWSLRSFAPAGPTGARFEGLEGGSLEIAPRLRAEFGFQLVAAAPGRIVLQGLAVRLRGPLGLFDMPLYFPNPLTIRVLPRVAARSRGLGRARAAASLARTGRAHVRRRGGGTELHELRELLPGDPFKAIAWKPSARAGTLLVREVEPEVQETRWVLIDATGSMRSGAPGARKLDFALELAATHVRIGLEEGDRVGLVGFDERPLAHVAPGDGPTQMMRLYDALLALTEVVDADLTDLEDDDVVRLVVRYLRHQDGVDFTHRREGRRTVDVAGLTAFLQSQVEKDPRWPVRAHSPIAALARRFCRERGLELPYRADPRDGTKAPALLAAIRAAGGMDRAPMDILCVSDFDGLYDLDVLAPTLRLVVTHGHALSFVLPDATTLVPEPTSRIERDLYAIYALAERRRLLACERFLRRHGARAAIIDARRGTSAALARLAPSRAAA